MSESQSQLLEEHKSQLAEIEELLEASPGDESLLKLKSDLVELIELTKSELDENHDDAQTSGIKKEEEAQKIPATRTAAATAMTEPLNTTTTPSDPTLSMTTNDGSNSASASAPATAEESSAAAQPKKKSKKSSMKILSEKFEIPSHLLPLESDTDAERTRKRRTIKALKSKFRSKQKTAETEVKQKSWQDFMSKGSGKRGNKIKGVSGSGRSIFATEDGISARVGVISGGTGRENPEEGQRVTKRLRHDF